MCNRITGKTGRGRNKRNAHGPQPQPPPNRNTPPTAAATTTPPPPPPYQDEWFCSNPPCQKPQLASAKPCYLCQTVRQKIPNPVSPLTQKIGLSKADQKLMDEQKAAEDQADGVGTTEDTAGEQQEEEANYLVYLKKTQELAHEFKKPPPAMQKMIEDRAAEIKKLEATAATRQAKSTSGIATSELRHEKKYQDELKILKEKLQKEEEGIKMTAANWKTRKEEEQERSKQQQEKIDTTFKKFGEDAVARKLKVEEEMKKMAEIHMDTMEKLKASRSSGEPAPGVQPEEGMVLVPVPRGVQLISPAQLSLPIIVSRMEAAAAIGGLQGITPEAFRFLAQFINTMVVEAGVLPEQNPQAPEPKQAIPAGRMPGGSDPSSDSSMGQTVPQPTGTSPEEAGTGEADPKHRRRELTDEQAKKEEAEFERLKNGGS